MSQVKKVNKKTNKKAILANNSLPFAHLAGTMHNIFSPYYANSLDPFIPELWANESLQILEEVMVIGQLVHRDFSNEIAAFGDVVNTRRPGEFETNRKGTECEDIVIQDSTATAVQVPLNQHPHVSFMICDGEQTKSFKDLVATYLKPAMLAIGRFVDQVLLGEVYSFIGNSYGGLETINASVAKEYILGTRNVLNVNKAYSDSRNLILTPNTETALLNLDLFTSAEKVGDGGTALRNASLGTKLGFDMYMGQNTPSIRRQATSVAADTLNGALAVGATSVVLTTGTNANLAVGNWIKIAGDDSPQQIITWTSGTKTAVVSPGLKRAALTGAAVTIMVQGAVNHAGGYAAGYAKKIVYDTFAALGDPQNGQLVSFGTTTGVVYSIVKVDTVNKTIFLDRPLETSIADDAAINVGPPGEYNLAIHRNAIAWVSRPLALPRAGAGALCSVVNFRSMSVRVSISYDAVKQGTLITLDMLCGKKLLDKNLGAIMLG